MRSGGFGSFSNMSRGAGSVQSSPRLASSSSNGSGVPALGSSGGSKRPPAFLGATPAHASLLSALQRSLFTRQHEEVVHALHVYPRRLDGADEQQAYLLVLTVNAAQQKKSSDAPKLHWLKVKAEAGEGAYTHKKFKLLRLLRRIELPSTGVGAAPRRGGTSIPLQADEFTLVMNSSGADKPYTFAVRNGGSEAGAALRSLFVWYAIEMCRINCAFVPASNVDTVQYQQLTNELISFYLSADAGSSGVAGSVSGAHKELLQGVSKNRATSLESDTRSLDRSNIEEKVVVPSMTAEETMLVQQFLKQMEGDLAAAATAAAAADGHDASAAVAALPPSHSHINSLEAYLTGKLATLESANIASLFDPAVERSNTRLLDEVQSNLLDHRLEEMSLWINHHSAEAQKMQKGIEVIEKRNLALDIAEKNQTRLHHTLRSVLDALTLDDPDADSDLEDQAGGHDSVEQLLLHPDFSAGKLEKTLAAAQRLDHMLHVQVEEGKLEELRAVREQRGKYEGVRKSFTRACAQASESIFADVAKKATAEAARAPDASGALALSTNAPQHRDLRRYASLLRYLERLELDLFLSLRPVYAASFRSVYDLKLRAYFASLRRSVAVEAKDTRMQAFPDWTVDMAKHSARKMEQGRSISIAPNNPQVAALLKQGPNASLPATQQGKLLATQAFVQALRNITPLCQSEEKFLIECFGLSPDSINGQNNPAPVNATHTHTLASHASSAAVSTPAGGPAAASASTPAHAPSAPRAAVPRSRERDREELQTMLNELFRALEPELKELAVSGGKMDHFYTLEMLVSCERLMQDNANPAASPTTASTAASSSESYLSSIVTSLSTALKLSFNAFVDAEIEWMTSQHPSPKRCGVLTPLTRFPAWVDRMENVVAAGGADSAAGTGSPRPGKSMPFARSQAADTSYQKLSSALFRWLESIARSDDKYTDVVMMENMHFFHSIFSTPHLYVPALEQSVQRAHLLYDTHCRRYVEWNIGYEMPTIVKFWDRLEDQLKSIPPEDIPFAAELSKHDLRALIKGPLAGKLLQKSLTNVLRRVEKHMPKNASMVNVVWRQIQMTFLGRFDRFEKLVADCYQNEKLSTTHDEVVSVFSQIPVLVTASSAAAASAKGAYAEVSVTRSRH